MTSFERDVAPGIHLLTAASVNCYLVEGDGGVVLVDAGLPAMWSALQDALEQLGYARDGLSAIVLTHAHFDHVGFAARARREHQTPVWVHPDDVSLARHPYRYRPERNRFLYPLRYPGGIPVLATMAAAGAFRVEGVDPTHQFSADDVLDVPGGPRVVFTPGHTAGHCALHFGDRDTVLSGDALVTLDPYTGRTGPHVVAAAATQDSALALRSLDALSDTGAAHVLPGHGLPWHDGVVAAAEQARANGVA